MKSMCLLFFFLFCLQTCSTSQPVTKNSAIHDFDFYIGAWEVQNNRQMDDGTWKKFKARVVVRKSLNGKGNVDFFESEIEGEPYHGMTIRTFDEENNEWHIRWIDTDDPTTIPVASKGSFKDGIGEFYKTITTAGGQEVMVRFLWSNIAENSFHWEAGWSVNGKNWTPVWTMEFNRLEQRGKF